MLAGILHRLPWHRRLRTRVHPEIGLAAAAVRHAVLLSATVVPDGRIGDEEALGERRSGVGAGSAHGADGKARHRPPGREG